MKHIKPYLKSKTFGFINDYVIFDISNVFINVPHQYMIGTITGTGEDLLVKFWFNSQELTRWIDDKYILFITSKKEDCEEYLNLLNNTNKYNL